VIYCFTPDVFAFAAGSLVAAVCGAVVSRVKYR